jgi:hypothetical protein
LVEGKRHRDTGLNGDVAFDQNLPADEQIQKAQKSLFAVASKSCSAVLETIADDCKITGMTSNVDMQRGNRDAIISVRGQISMSIKLKPSAPASK